MSDIQLLEEVVVTATRRTESIMDVPFSVNVQEEADIQRLNTFNLEKPLPEHRRPEHPEPGTRPDRREHPRGFRPAQIVRDQPGIKEQVGIYLDDTPIAISLFTPDLDLYDVQRVETLRGPQGTLFGSGSIGGTVRYVTNKPQLGVKDVQDAVRFEHHRQRLVRRTRQGRLQTRPWATRRPCAWWATAPGTADSSTPCGKRAK